MANRPKIGFVEVPPALLELLASRGQQPPTEPERSMADTVTDIVKQNLRGCEDPEHRDAERALYAFLKATCKHEGLSERIVEPFFRTLAAMTLHQDARRDLGKSLQRLFDGNFYGDAMIVAATISAVYEHPEWLTPEPPKPAEPGQGMYL